MKTIKISLIALLLTLTSTVANAEWTDVTTAFIANPGFTNNNSSGWTRTGAGSVNVNYECMEVYQGYFDLYTTLKNLPRGHYRLSVQAFYRDGSHDVAYYNHVNGTESLPVVLYAGDNQTQVVSIYSFGYDSYMDYTWQGSDGKYYPDQMWTATPAFEQGEYVNFVEFDADGDIRIGIKNDEYKNANWCIFDNFKLEYEGSMDIVQATSLEVIPGSFSIDPGQTKQLTAKVLPTNTSNKTIGWDTFDPHVAVVDGNGLVTAVAPGTTLICARTEDGSKLFSYSTVSVTPKKVNGWADVTNLLVQNAYFDSYYTYGWTRENTGNCNQNFGALEVWNGTFDIRQKLVDLPAGNYRLSVQGYYRDGNNIDQGDNRYEYKEDDNYYTGGYVNYRKGTEALTAVLYANEHSTPLKSIYSEQFDDYVGGCWYVVEQKNGEYTYTYYPNNMETASYLFAEGKYATSVEFSHQGDLTIGVKNSNYVQGNWAIWDNFKLEYDGEVKQVSDIKITAPKTRLMIDEQVQLTAVVTPSDAMNKKVTFYTDDENILTVSKDGLVTAKAIGETKVYAYTMDGSDLVASVQITVAESTGDQNALIINEIMVANVDEYPSPAFNFDGWMELYNPSSQAMELVGLYVSDDTQNLTKWRIPAGIGVMRARGYKTIWFGSNDISTICAPFELDNDGGTIYLSDKNGNLISSVTYPAGIERASYARTTDNGDTWSYCATPTLEKTNAGAKFANAQLAEPVVDQPSQLYSGKLSVNVTIPAGTTLRYTTDGSLPTMTNGQTSTTGQFSVENGNVNYRFRLFADGTLPSRVTTRSYILRDRDYSLPVISVVGDNALIYGDELGVIARGVNGRPGNGQSGNCNWNMNWTRAVNFSYLDADGQMVFNQDANMEACGGWSRAWDPKAFKLKGNKELGGDKNLAYPFFSDKPYIRNRTLQIRNGGNDTGCRFRDPALQYIAQSSGLNIDLQSYEPVHEFINGNYIGVLNMREPNNKHFVYANYGWGDDEIDQFEMSPDSGYVQKCGSDSVFVELVDVLSPSAANPETYAEICRILDIDAYANYMAAELYLKNWDWPQNNVKGFRYRGEGGKFRFVLFDLDGSFNGGSTINGFMGKEVYQFDPLFPSSLGRITDQIRMVTLFKNMLTNDTFRRMFIDAFCMMGGSVYEANRASEIIDQLYQRVEPAMNISGESASSTANSVKSNLISLWQNDYYTLTSYYNMGLDGVMPQWMTLTSDVKGANLYVNDMIVPTGSFNGKIFAPAKLRAEAPAGYTFLGWKSSQTTGLTIIDFNSSWKYYDQGSLDNANWTSPTYSANSWSEGYAPLGYGKNDINTTLDYGSDSQNKRPTAYFRTTVNITEDINNYEEMIFNYVADDGFVLYVNGQEVTRVNMPDGSITFNSYSSHYAYDNPDRGNIHISPNYFKKGENVLAIELHNCDNHSTDLYWNASLSATLRQASSNYYSTKNEISLPDDATVELRACFKQMTAAERSQQGINPVRINEVSGSNDRFVNEYFKKNDWLELVNTTDADIDVEGMYLSNDVNEQTKWKITKGDTRANTIIPAHGHLLIWCDKLETTDKALHAPFKVSSTGGSFTLMAADKSWTDVFTFGVHDANTTIGRYPDGANSVYAMDIPTIEKTNILTSYATVVEQKSIDDIIVATDIASVQSANGFRIIFGAQQLIVKSEDSKTATVDIFTTDGRLIETQQVSINNGSAYVSVAHLPKGFYVARATDEGDTTVGCKFMR